MAIHLFEPEQNIKRFVDMLLFRAFLDFSTLAYSRVSTVLLKIGSEETLDRLKLLVYVKNSISVSFRLYVLACEYQSILLFTCI